MSNRTRWAIYIFGNAAIAVAVWLTAPEVFGERPPLWIWALVVGVMLVLWEVMATRRRRLTNAINT
jgi:hypothetical protein